MHIGSDETSTTYICGSGEALPILLAVPREHRPQAGVIFFHGGGWIAGGPEQFLPQCHALAHAGVLSATARYRLLGSGASELADCVADARAAIERFLDVAADHDLGPSRVAAGGGSAGAYLALSAALSLPGIGHDGSPKKSAAELDSTARSALPREEGEPISALGALLLFNPVVDLGDVERALLGFTPPRLGRDRGRVGPVLTGAVRPARCPSHDHVPRHRRRGRPARLGPAFP